MPLKVGTKNVIGLAIGTNSLLALYKGTTLLYQSASWELYSKVYFYNELVPTTINSKNVLNKAKIVKVSGNGAIENQLVQNGDFNDGINNWSGYNGTLSASNNVLSYTITFIGGDYGSNRIVQLYTHLANHYYLIDIWVKTPYATMVRCYIDNFVDLGTTVANQWTRLTKLYKPTSSSGTNNIYFDVHGQASYQVGDVIQVRQYQKKDLTLREGTGNEPTTLTDNRIQNILNRGYIPFNLGEYKESDIGEFSSYIYPPQLLGAKSLLGKQNVTTTKINGGFYRVSNDGTWLANYEDANNNKITALSTTHKYLLIYQSTDNSNDEILTCGNVAYDPTQYQWNAVNIVNSYSSGQFLSIKFTTNYTSSRFGFMGSIGTIIYKEILLDLTELGLENKTAQEVFEMLSNDALDKLANGDTLNDVLDTLTFKAQLGGAINSHNTMEITNSEYVFTRNAWKVDLGSVTWEYAGANIFYKDISNIKNTADNTLGDIITPIYTSVKRNNLGDKTICISGTSIITKDSAYTNASVYKTAMSGIYAHYPLATPQVITIPRKHLGIVDLGSLNWEKATVYGRTMFRTVIEPVRAKTGNDGIVGNIYCENYLTTNYTSLGSGDNIISLRGIANEGVVIYDSSKTSMSATDFKNAMAGQYLFYETENEVADITDTIDIESGGTISANWFRWKENQLVNKANYKTNSSAFTADTTTGKIEFNLSTFVSYANAISTDFSIPVVNGHKYLLIGFKTTSTASSDSSWWLQIRTTNGGASGRLYNQYEIFTSSQTGNADILVYIYNGFTANDKIVGYPQLIDLTLGELEDVTSINDPRIQEIIRLGYIPTNTTGTYKEVSPSVLPNVELSVKCK